MLICKCNEFKFNSYFIIYKPEFNQLQIKISHGILTVQLCFSKQHIFDLINGIGKLKAISIISENALSEYNKLLKKENFDYKIEEEFRNELCSDLKIVIDSIMDTFVLKYKHE